jgi:hypothetical protein
MKTVYEAANAIEAHMVLDLLKQEGLSAQLHGEHLPGAVGELPAAGLVRLVIHEADFARAREVIERWDAAQPKDITPRPAKRKSSVLTAFLVGLLVGTGAAYGFFRSPVTADGIDHNRDGLLDDKWTYSASGTALANEVDRNLDRKVDYIARFDRQGLIEAIETDDNFDGVFEGRSRYRHGNAEVTEADTDGDGFPDLRSYFTNGVHVSTEYLNPSTGLPLRVETIVLGKVTQADVDTDRDGKLDTRVLYSPLGEVRATERLPR